MPLQQITIIHITGNLHQFFDPLRVICRPKTCPGGHQDISRRRFFDMYTSRISHLPAICSPYFQLHHIFRSGLPFPVIQLSFHINHPIISITSVIFRSVDSNIKIQHSFPVGSQLHDHHIFCLGNEIFPPVFHLTFPETGPSQSFVQR